MTHPVNVVRVTTDVPYGLVGQVLPYLIRRAQENSDVMGGVKHEQGLIRAELWRRMFSA